METDNNITDRRASHSFWSAKRRELIEILSKIMKSLPIPSGDPNDSATRVSEDLSTRLNTGTTHIDPIVDRSRKLFESDGSKTFTKSG